MHNPPTPQDNLQRAAQLAFDAAQRQSAEQLQWLGARPGGTLWRLPVLDELLAVDLPARRVTSAAGQEIKPAWLILVLHYLAIASHLEPQSPQIAFADLPGGRTYARVYQQRAIARLCATAGRDARRLQVAATAIGGNPVPGGDAAFEFDVFPRLRVRLVWHAADDEFPPSATLLLPPNIESYFCIEDIVVLSERLVARLAGQSL